MAKIKIIGSGFIQVKEETLYNLKAYKNIERYTFAYDEDPVGKSAFGIQLTPLAPSKENFENGVDGSFFIATYTYEEENEFKEDFETIIYALKN